MKAMNLFLFLFIILINTKIFAYSQNCGYISLTYKEEFNQKTNLSEKNIELNCNTGEKQCNISLPCNFSDFTDFFETNFDAACIESIDLSNLKLPQIN